MRDSVVFFKSFFEAIEELPLKYQAPVYAAVFRYSFNGEIPDLTGVAKALFIIMKANIDASEKRYAAAIENGKKGGRPRKEAEKAEETEENPIETERKPNQNPTETERKPNQNLTVTDNDTDTVTDNATATDTDTENDNEAVDVASSATVNPVSKEAFAEVFCEEETEEEEGTQTAEQTEDAEQEPVESLPLLGGREYPVFRSDIEKWAPSYSGLDIESELHRMKAWLDANPNKKKAPMDIQRFIAGWLSREWKEQKSKPSYNISKQSAPPKPKEIGFDVDDFWKNAIARSEEIAAELDRENRERAKKHGEGF